MSDEKRKDHQADDRKKPRMPAAGPHAREDLTNHDATPGTGSLPGPDEDDDQDTISS